MTIDLDKLLEDVAADLDARPLKGMSDNKAAALCKALRDVRAQLVGGRGHWERRRAELKRQETWLLMNLSSWAIATSNTTSMKTFPCGLGMAKVQKARARTEWTDETTEWLRKIARVDPECAKAFDHERVLKTYVDWSAPSGKGIREAVAMNDVGPKGGDDGIIKGEILKGLRRYERPDELTVSINTEARD
jgi:hypothetical protein